LTRSTNEHWFSRFASEAARQTGRPWTFGLAGGFVLAWLVSGPMFGFSDTWQLVMNTISSVVTFLMVFLIQNTQNRDSAALQVKIDELIRATSSRRDLIGIEEMSGPELDSKRREIRMEDQGKSNL
jgi:low affinity Fe/Cu permease